MWSDLDLSVVYKSCIHKLEQASPTIELSFGIQKRLENPEKVAGRKVPNILKDPGDLIPPADMRTACITSIDVTLEYSRVDDQRLRTYTPYCIASRALHKETYAEEDDIIPINELGDLGWDGVHCLLGSTSTSRGSSDSIPGEEFRSSKEGWGSDCYLLSELPNSLDLEALLREGFRTMVWGDATQEGNKNQPGTENFLNLSRIAPLVFKPGYYDVRLP
jgi:hypothetical protein